MSYPAGLSRHALARKVLDYFARTDYMPTTSPYAIVSATLHAAS